MNREAVKVTLVPHPEGSVDRLETEADYDAGDAHIYVNTHTMYSIEFKELPLSNTNLFATHSVCYSNDFSHICMMACCVNV